MDEIVLRNKIETLDCKTNISFNLDNNINDLMIQSDHEQRLLIIDKIEKKVREENPVAGDIEVYKNAIVKGIVKPKEDFDLKYEGTLNISGNFSEDGISKIGGISPEYKRRVENRAEFNHWKKYWYLYEALSRGAKKTVFIDNNYDCISILKKNLNKIGISQGSYDIYNKICIYEISKTSQGGIKIFSFNKIQTNAISG